MNEANKIGILVSWKKGQNRIDDALKLKKELRYKGKEVFILCFDRVSIDQLAGLKYDHIINLACPRIDMDLISQLV